MAKKERAEIPQEVAARILFLSDRTCCVCRIPRKAIQIHHIDEDPSNSAEENLAVLCLECHRETQISGGFDRKLEAHQLILYRKDWYGIVDRKRHGPEGLLDRQAITQSWNWVPGLTQVRFQGVPVRLSYLQVSEKDEENRYSFSAEYPEIMPNDVTGAFETNLCVAAFISRTLQRFRAEAISRSFEKNEILKQSPHQTAVWDDVSISFDVVLFCDDLLTLDFQLASYMALAAHPNSNTKTMNFLLRPWATPLELYDLFEDNSGYLKWISQYCIDSLHRQRPHKLKIEEKDSWILKGAAPQCQNFEKFLITKNGLRIVFDPYQVSSHAEGRREVFIPGNAIKPLLKEPFRTFVG